MSAEAPGWPGLIEAYRERLPVSDSTPVVTLQEGNTPLLPAPELSRRTGCEVYLKVEGANPTGSFKDRGMTMAITKAVEEGAKAVICASTGNTSASAAAYAARAGITCAVLVPQGKIAMGKLAQALVHGAQLLQVEGNFDDCLALASKLAIDYPVSLVNSVNQFRIEGQKTASFEIVDVLGDAPDIHCLPVGNAGNITAYWQGYREYAADGIADAAPRACGASRPPAPRRSSPARSSSTRARSRRRSGSATRRPGPRRSTPATSSGGRIDAVTDRAILAAYRLLARSEAVFVEPASAASVAGLLQVAAAGELEPGQRVVCTVTGNGLKDPEWAISGAPAPRDHPGRRRRGRRAAGPVTRSVRGPRPGDQREPRAGVRLRRPGADPVRRPRVRRPARRAWRCRSPASARGSCPPTSRTWSSAPSGPPATQLGWTPPGLRVVADNGIPQGRGMGSSAAAVVAGVRGRLGAVPGRRRRRRRRRAPADHRARGAPRQRGALPARRGDAVLDGGRRSAARSGSTSHPTSVPVVLVPGAHPVHARRPRPAARRRAARRRRLQRRPRPRCWCTR